jgi:hypothetical protein
MQHSIEVVSGIPQIVYHLPLDKAVSVNLADLNPAHMLDPVIIGPTQFAWAMYAAFSATLAAMGVANAGQRVFVSDIPIRS